MERLRCGVQGGGFEVWGLGFGFGVGGLGFGFWGLGFRLQGWDPCGIWGLQRHCGVST